MAARVLDSATITKLQDSGFVPVWFIRLDFQGDPVYINTSLSTISFAGGLGYDPAIVGFNFLGVGNIGTIDAVTDSIDGSQTMNLTLPAVSLSNDYLHQIITNGDLWQRYWAYIWLATYDNTGALLGKPFRVKTARMDKLVIDIDPDNAKGTLTLSLESQQAYSGDALNTRYTDQRQFIDPNDSSQDYVANLANQIPGMGPAKTPAANNLNLGGGRGFVTPTKAY
jgi:hypothetical protein